VPIVTKNVHETNHKIKLNLKTFLNEIAANVQGSLKAADHFHNTAASEPVSSPHKEQHPIVAQIDRPILVLKDSLRPR